MRNILVVLAGAAVALVGSTSASALSIVLSPDESFIASPNGAAALLGFQKAANYWNKTISTPGRIDIDISFAPLPPNVIGGASTNQVLTSASQVYRQLAATGNSGLDAVAVANLRPLTAAGGLGYFLPGGDSDGNLSVDVPAVFDNDDSVNNRFLAAATSINKALGIDFDPAETVFGLLADFGFNPNADSALTFSSDFAFDFDPTDGVTPATIDFVSVATHELGHALGFLSGTDSYDLFSGPDGAFAGFVSSASANGSAFLHSLDLFRYGSGTLSATGRELQLTPGRGAFFSVDGQSPFNFNDPLVGSSFFAQGVFNGDRRQASHWQDSNAFATPDGCTVTERQIGIMDPSIGFCQSAVVTSNDLAAFDAMGWNIGPDILNDRGYTFDTSQIFALDGLARLAVPEPATWVQLILGFGVVGGILRKDRRARSTARRGIRWR